MELLLIEDNKDIAETVAKYLRTHEITVDIAYAGDSGLEMAFKKFYDIILLDLMLPGLDGFEFLEKLRTKRSTPVIITSAKGQLGDKESGFGLGADDYLVKPYSLKELYLRIKAVTSRTEISEVYRFRNIEILFDQKEVYMDGELIPLPLKEMQILVYLTEKYPTIVSRTELIDFLWGGDVFDHDSILDVYISNLRKKLDKDLIVTIKGLGYKIGSDKI